jgi:hypothetical protein
MLSVSFFLLLYSVIMLNAVMLKTVYESGGKVQNIKKD